jgi:hypothetical protein
MNDWIHGDEQMAKGMDCRMKRYFLSMNDHG